VSVKKTYFCAAQFDVALVVPPVEVVSCADMMIEEVRRRNVVRGCILCVDGKVTMN
jgi:hypothetical protein